MDVIKTQTESSLGFPPSAQYNYLNITNNGPLDSLQNSNVVSCALNVI